MAEYLTNTTDLTKVADAIRTKGGTSAALAYPDEYVSAINAITTGTELKIVVSVPTGATVTATKGGLSVSGISANGTCTLVVPEAGTWSVNATLNGQTSNTKSVSIVDSYALTLSFATSTLNDNEWSVIKTVSDAGEGANYWSIGDRKAVVLNGTVGALSLSNVTTYAFIIGFNHNSSVEGSNRIHFQLAKTALSGGTDIAFCGDYFYMNSSETNSGGWRASQMRTNICGTSLSSYSGTIIAVIPAALRAVLKSVTKYTDNTGGGSSASAISATTDYFFLLSEYEVFGTTLCANDYESSKQKQYDYYSAGNSKIKYMHRSPSTAVFWLLRSPYANYSDRFTGVSPNGRINGSMANYSAGLAPGFCVQVVHHGLYRI